MRRTTWVVAAGAALAVLAGPAVFAQAAGTTAGTTAAAKPANSQQEKMKTCNSEATSKGMHGASRKAFMSSCLSGEDAAKPANSQQEKMKTCNAEATSKGMKGADRKTFMSTCLKGSGSAAAK
ncbi:MAG TPA: PsiF family protein [Steroidobacteraceae bacterium]